MEITKDKVTELFCIIDEFYKVFDAGKLLLGEDGVKRRRRKASLSDNCLTQHKTGFPTPHAFQKFQR